MTLNKVQGLFGTLKILSARHHRTYLIRILFIYFCLSWEQIIWYFNNHNITSFEVKVISQVLSQLKGKKSHLSFWDRSQGFFAAEIGLYEARFILSFFAPGLYQIWSSFQVLSDVVHANQDSLFCIKICLKLVHFCFCRELAFLTPSHHMAWENLAPFSHKHVCKHTIKAHKFENLCLLHQ